ncbi:MAG TPA: hypothetical protein ENI08_00300 [Candidatus Dependentiae bacterium]|nr:hypothetical protein [Candidatus Dependentiae bacterium]
MKNILLLGSKSQSRQLLLREIQIPFELVEQHADETQCDWGLPLSQLVQTIARHKMNHVVLPTGDNDAICFVLTADTLSQDKSGVINGKPIDKNDAIIKIKRAREGTYLCTAFCLDKKVWHNGAWQIEERIEEQVHAEYSFIVPDDWIAAYLEKSLGLQASNAIAVEGFGSQFLQTIRGSYTAIVGLPLFQVRKALESIEFFAH